jgi:hypothetical protein
MIKELSCTSKSRLIYARIIQKGFSSRLMYVSADEDEELSDI